MEVKKAIKRVFALAAGATMMGATILGAMAASDLANYPAPFVKNGKFDAFIVVGDAAAAEDVVGAVDIGASLQFEMKKETAISAGTAGVIISDGVKIRGTGSEVLNYGENIGEVRSTPLDSEDLPVLLAEGRYVESEGATDNDETYTQELLLAENEETHDNGYATHDQPDDDLNADDYLELTDGDVLYTYTLEFDDAVEFENIEATDGSCQDDIEGTQIEIQGNLYTITDSKLVSVAGGGCDAIDDITLMAGDTLVWLMQDQVVEKTVAGVKHEIKVVDVTDAEDSCGVSVDGSVAWIDVKSDKVINGVDIGVLDAKAVHAQLQDVDICELNIGATDIKIEDAYTDDEDDLPGTITVDGEEIDDAEVGLLSTDGGLWNSLIIQFSPDDDVYLAKDQEFRDPVLGRFKVLMGGVLTPRELIDVAANGARKGDLKFTNNDGKLVEVPLEIETAGIDDVQWGNGDDNPLLIDGDVSDCGVDTASIEDCDGVLLYAITSGNSAHVLEITKVDADDTTSGCAGACDGTISLKDLTYGRTFEDKGYNEGGYDIDLGSLGTINLNLDETCSAGADTCIDDSDLAQGDNIAETSYGANLEVLSLNENSGTSCASGNNCEAVWFAEEDLDDENIDAAGSRNVNINVWYDDGSDEQLKFLWTDDGATPTQANDEWVSVAVDKIYDDSDVSVSATAHGTLVEYDEQDEKWIKIMYPQEEVEVNAFIAPISAQITSSGGAISTVTLDKINVGAARLASEISDVTTDNLILVGGACANAATAAVQGVAYQTEPECLGGLQAGEAVIKLYDQSSGKVAMVVAGLSAMDTRRATRVAANFDAFNLSGSEVKVTGTSLTDIKVSAPS